MQAKLFVACIGAAMTSFLFPQPAHATDLPADAVVDRATAAIRFNPDGT